MTLRFVFDSDSSGAVFSPCKRYRYRLWRKWTDGPRACWVMLNPSTATEVEDDPTIRRCINFSKAWGYGSLDVVNIFAFRSTDPGALYTEGDPIGPDNDSAILQAGSRAEIVVAAWGVHGALHERGTRVIELLKKLMAHHPLLLGVHCLGRTKEGHPKHPLYLANNTKPQLLVD